MSRVFRALQPFQRSITQPQVRAFSEGAGPDLGGKFMAGMGAAAFSQCQKYVRRLFAPAGPTPSQQLSQYAYGKTIDSKPVAPQVVSQMEMVGMKEFMAVQRMVVPKDLLREKVHVGLAAKGLPSKVAQAISLALDQASCYQDMWDDFQVEDGTGSAHSYRVIVRMSEFDGHCDCAIAASGASFNAAKEVSHYETKEIAEYGDVPELVTEYEDGFFGRYEKQKTVMRRRQIGKKTLKIPIFKQKTFTPQTMQDMKDYLEGKAMKEVLRLCPPAQQNRMSE